MTVQIYLKAIPYDKSLVLLGLESGVDGILTEKEQIRPVQSLGRTAVYTPDDLHILSLNGKEEENLAREKLQKGASVLLQKGWEIIPVENLLAQGDGRLGVEVDSLQQAKLALGILEKGVDFIVVLPEAKSELKKMVTELKLSQGQLELEKARITSISNAGMGHRVCVDTCSLLQTGQGILSGNSGNFLFLVHAETEANPYVAARPFRINAGTVHAYVLRTRDRTSYLEEMQAGEEILITDHNGNTGISTIGRTKIEIRPLLLIEAETETKRGSIFLQNAETIRLVKSDGIPVSVVSLKQGDEILCRTDQAGRHFGMRIQEYLEEK